MTAAPRGRSRVTGSQQKHVPDGLPGVPGAARRRFATWSHQFATKGSHPGSGDLQTSVVLSVSHARGQAR